MSEESKHPCRRLYGRKWVKPLDIPEGLDAAVLQERFIPYELVKPGRSRFPRVAHELLGAAFQPLVWLRDHRGWKLNGRVLVRSLSIDGLLGLAHLPDVPAQQTADLHEICSPLFDGTLRKPRFAFSLELSAPTYRDAALVKAAYAQIHRTRNPERAGTLLREGTGWEPIDNWIIQFGYVGMTLCRLLRDGTPTLESEAA